MLALRLERGIRSPLALGGPPAHRADDLSGRDDDAQVVAERRDELLHEHAVVRNHGRSEITASASVSCRPRVVQSITSLPHDPNRGSSTTGKLDRPDFACAFEVDRPRMRQACGLEQTGRLELVVRRHQSAERIEDPGLPRSR